MKQAHVPDLPNSAHELRTNLLDFLEKTDIQERLWLDHNEEGDMAVSMTTFKERLECEAVRSFGDDTTLDVYFKKLRKRNAWGDGATLLAAACVYKTVIVCYHAANESGNTVIKVTEMWHDYQPTHTIYVACLHDNHFFSTELLSPSHTDSLQCGICQQNISDACSTVSCDEHPKHASCFAEIVLRTANTFCEHESPAGACNKALPLRLVAPAIIPLMGAFLGQADVRDVTQKKFGKRLTELQLKRMKEILHLDIPLFEYPTDIPFHHYEQERNSTKSLWLCELCCDSSCFNLSHALYLLGHPAGPGGPLGHTSNRAVHDSESPICFERGKCPYFASSLPLRDDEVPRLNPTWLMRNNIILHMMGPKEKVWQTDLCASADGYWVDVRMWCCLAACQQFAAENESKEMREKCVAMTLLAASLIKLHYAVLKSTGSMN
mmetsp:Transcript_29463/g.61711  ORF Transcript_29463/g.61711 Transcript_29463/m.61711 type:complete len:436 (+) Transcript_29463:513-1820(+)